MWAVLGNEVAVRDGPIYVFEANDVGVRNLLEDLYLIIEHFKARGGVLLELDDLYGVLGLVIDVLAAVDVACVARTDLVPLLVVVVADCLGFVLEANHRLRGEKVAGRTHLTQLLDIGFLKGVVDGGDFVGRVMTLLVHKLYHYKKI